MAVEHSPPNHHGNAPEFGTGPRLPPLRCWGPPRPSLPAPDPHWRLLARAGNRLFLDKPGQLQVHPSKPGDPFTLWDGLVRTFAWEWVVEGAQVSILTRLDRETSGVVLVALSSAEARQLGRAIQRQQLGKEYLALVHGWPKRQKWTVDAPLTDRRRVDPQAPIGVEQIVHPTGRAARTDFAVAGKFQVSLGGNPRRLSLLRVRPLTGRMHQIRVHAAASGHPLLGDKLYGQPPSTYLRWIDEGWTPALAQRLLWPRQALHCRALTLEGTRTVAPLPPDWQELFRRVEAADWEGEVPTELTEVESISTQADQSGASAQSWL